MFAIYGIISKSLSSTDNAMYGETYLWFDIIVTDFSSFGSRILAKNFTGGPQIRVLKCPLF